MLFTWSKTSHQHKKRTAGPLRRCLAADTIALVNATSLRPIGRFVPAAVLILIILLAIALRLDNVQESLWVDELHTAWTIDGSLAQLPQRAAIGNYSPTYFLLPWLSTRLLGLNEVALRLPSLLAGVAIVPLLYVAVVRLGGTTAAGLLAAFLGAIDSNFIFFSQEARPFALVQLVGLGQLLIFWHILHGAGRVWRLVTVLLTVLLFYLHYTAILLVAAELMFYLTWWCAGRIKWAEAPKCSPLAVFVTGALVLALCLPSLGHLYEIAQRRENWATFIKPQGISAVLTMFPLSVPVLLPLLLLAIAIAGRFMRRLRPLTANIAAGPLALVICWFAVPLLCVWLATYWDVAPLLLRRYVMVAAAAPLVLGGLLVSLIPSRAMQVFAMLLVGAVAVWEGPYSIWQETGEFAFRRNEDWRTAVRLINTSDEGRTWPVLVRSGLIEADQLLLSDNPTLQNYCLLPVNNIYAVDRDRSDLFPLPSKYPGYLSGNDVRQLVKQPGVWLLLRGDRHTKNVALKQLAAIFGKAGRRTRVQQSIPLPGVWVVRIQLEKEAHLQ